MGAMNEVHTSQVAIKYTNLEPAQVEDNGKDKMRCSLMREPYHS